MTDSQRSNPDTKGKHATRSAARSDQKNRTVQTQVLCALFRIKINDFGSRIGGGRRGCLRSKNHAKKIKDIRRLRAHATSRVT